jgi:hypothetical protein
MRPSLRLLLLCLLAPPVAAQQPSVRPVTIEWTWQGTRGDAFVVDRCRVNGPHCVLLPTATLPLTLRSWTDYAVLRQHTYCYRLAVVTGSVRGPDSNTACSP